MSVHREQIDRYKKLKAQENQVLYGGPLTRDDQRSDDDVIGLALRKANQELEDFLIRHWTSYTQMELHDTATRSDVNDALAREGLKQLQPWEMA